jgi:hypothetical protein
MMLKSSFDTYTGYGNDAVDMAIWFTKAGVDVVPWPSAVMSVSAGLQQVSTSYAGLL